MKQSDLRQAVSTVRWDTVKRLSIEEKLRQNVCRPEEFDDLSEEFIETDLVTMDDVMTEEDMRMERKRIIRNTIIGLIAAAVLCTGGVVASVAMRGRNGKPESSDSSVQPQAESSAAIPTVQTLDLPLTDQQDEPSLRVQDVYLNDHGFAASDTGWYFTDSSMEKNGKEVFPLWYSDNDTGECVMLCARPNCLHDGSEYCTATTKAYQRMTAPVWLDGYIYALAIKPDGENLSEYAAMGGEEKAGSVVLLRYARDGSEITEIAEIVPQTEESISIGLNTASLIAHRGQLWYSIGGMTRNAAANAVTEFYRTGVYAPQSGTVTLLLSDEKLRGYAFTNKGAPMNLLGNGDFVYFKFDAAGKWDDGNNLRTGIWRISCVTGAAEQVYACDSTVVPSVYYVSGDRIAFSRPNGSMQGNNDFIVYDIGSGEEKCLFKGNDLTRFNITFRADSDYLYLCYSDLGSDNTDVRSELRVSDWDGNVQKFSLPTDLEWKYNKDRMHESLPHMDETAGTISLSADNLMLHDGKLYVEYYLSWYCLPVSDVLRGAQNWQPAFSHDIWK